MQDTPLRLGFLGFGEAGDHFGKGLTAAGLAGIVAYSPSGAKAASGDPVHARALAAGVTLVDSPRTLAERADLILGLTPGKAALPALRALKRHLATRHLYVDASTNSVRNMQRAAALVAGRCGFADAAIMGSVPLAGIKVPVVAAGSHAEAFRAALAPFGMHIQVVGAEPGAASAMKLIRSVCMKGIAAVLIESLEAAERAGVRDFVATDIAASIDERPFEQIIKRYVCGSAVHAGRRVHEMTESLELLRTLGAASGMTRATRAKLAALAAMGLRERFEGREPDNIAPVMQAIVAAARAPG